MTPFELIPPIKDYIWGGTRLRDEYGKESELDRLAESWELSCHKDGQSIIKTGEYAGMMLSEFIAAHPEALGSACGRFEYFPVLIKLIDAHDNLSVQVHPDNEYALRVEGEYGKTEMWFIVDCEPGAELIYGFRESITREQFRKAIEDNTLLDYVNRVPVKKGDVFFIKSGTLHAIGKGILIAEIQQNSNTTYRVYDYGRKGADGKPRQLHIDKAVEVTNLEYTDPERPVYGVQEDGAVVQLLADCEYFTVNRAIISTELKLSAGEDSFAHVLTVDGSGELTAGDCTIALKKGTSVFVPAGTGAYSIKGSCDTIITTIS